MGLPIQFQEANKIKKKPYWRHSRPLLLLCHNRPTVFGYFSVKSPMVKVVTGYHCIQAGIKLGLTRMFEVFLFFQAI